MITMEASAGLPPSLSLLCGVANNRPAGYNTGFIIMRNGQELMKVLDDWITCPDKVNSSGSDILSVTSRAESLQVPGCDRWNNIQPGDQGVFCNFIVSGHAAFQLRSASSTHLSHCRQMPKLVERRVLTVIPCDEATGNTRLAGIYGSWCVTV
jgi:uncharacterized protein YaiE (UPF0345 family)